MSTVFYFHVGKIVQREDESFWLFPRDYISLNHSVLVHSPFFTHLNEKWRLVIQGKSEYSDVNLYLWKESCRNVLDCSYSLEFTLVSLDGKIAFRTGGLTSDYEFEVLKFCRKVHISGCGGQNKIFFKIQEKCNIDDIPLRSLDSDSNKDDRSREYESDNEGETSSEDEISSDGENKEKKSSSSIVKGIKSLSENLKQVLIDERMTDAVLKVDDREFKVHKIILVARSPVFASMFEHDMAEKRDNEVDIPDCTAESFEVFLHYLYSGSVETLSSSNVYNVYYAADKYRVDDLKEKCVKFMTKNISVETFCDVFALSVRHRESKLQKTTTDFFCRNIKKIIKTVQWQKYMDENSTQANELIIKALNA